MTTMKGNQLALCNGYTMILHKPSADGTHQFWRCSKQKQAKCRGRATSLLGSTTLTQTADHNHPPYPLFTKRAKPERKPMPFTLRWGIVGCGNISNDFTTALCNAKGRHRVCGVAASSLPRAEEFRKRLQLSEARAHGSYDDLFADDNIDIVYIGLLNHQHKEAVLNALEHGKHCLCEKPLGVNAKEVRAMVQKAKERKLFLMEGYWSRFFPTWQHLRTSIDSSGRPLLVQADLGYDAHAANKMELLKGGGNLMATGCYPIMFALWVFGAEATLERVTANGHRDANGIDLWGSVTLEFSENRVAHLFYTGLVCSPSHALVSGTTGRLSLPQTFWCATELHKRTNNPETGECSEEKRSFPIQQKADGHYNYPNSAGFQYEADHVFDCIQRGLTESEQMSWNESLRIAEILDEVRRQLGVVFPQDSENS